MEKSNSRSQTSEAPPDLEPGLDWGDRENELMGLGTSLARASEASRRLRTSIVG